MRRLARARRHLPVCAAVLALCSAAAATGAPVPDANPSTYRAPPSEPTAIVHATILTAAGPRILDGTVLMRDGKIVSVGHDVAIPAEARIIQAGGRWVTPGLIDPHTHYGLSGTLPNMDVGNELTSPNSAELRVEDSIWTDDPKFLRALEGGVTTLMVLPGSGNLFGGRAVTLRNLPTPGVSAMKFPGAPSALKMATGENPLKVYGAKGRAPSTTMGEFAGYRQGWLEATDYARKPAGGKRDLRLETLAGVLDGSVLVQNHVYRADQMVTLIAVSHEYGFHITAFHHAIEAYKIAPLLAREHICAVVWSQLGDAKAEMYDMVPANAALLEKAGVCVAIHSDFPNVGEHLNLEAAIAMGAGARIGMEITDEQAIRWLTANPAKVMGIDKMVGTLEPGKIADVILWSAEPFSSYARPELVFMDGALVVDSHDPHKRPIADFELGQPTAEERP